MSFKVPIDHDDIEDLPDNSSLIENLAESDKVTTILPRYLGTAAAGRFVAAFFLFHGECGKKVTLFTRRYSTKESKPEKRTTISLSNPPTVLGSNIWNQTVVIFQPDINEIERLKRLAEYDCYWLTHGKNREEPFDEVYREEPFATNLHGLPECVHANALPAQLTPNLDIEVSLCGDCDIPLFVRCAGRIFEASETLLADFIGVPSSERSAKGKRTSPTGDVSREEISLHVLSRFAHAEQDHFDVYTRRGDYYGYLVTLSEAIVGYALWNELHGEVALQQIYVFPPYRGSRLGDVIVRSWYEQLEAESDFYYAVGPNNAGLSVLNRIGHIEEEIALPSTILSCREEIY